MIARACIFFLVLSAVQVQAQPLLKQNFGQGGKLQLQIDDYTEAVDLQLAGGDSLLLLAYCGHSDTLYYDMDVALVMLDPSGNPVPSFGQNGTTRFDFGGMDYSTAREVRRCAGGDWLVLGTGYAMSNTDYAPFCITRLHSNGTIDSSFGNSGTAYVSFYGGLEFPGALKTDSAGRILLAGGSYDTIGNHNVPVAGRFFADAQADSSFGGTGKQVIDFTLGLQALRIIPENNTEPQHLTGGEVYDLLSLPGGGMLVAGSYGPDCFVAKFKENGELDSNFHFTGYHVFQIEALYNNRAEKALLLPDGSVLLGIAVDKSTDRDYHFVRISPVNGAVLGSEYADFSSNEDRLSDLALTPAGAVVAAGRSMTPAHAILPGYRSDWFTVNVIGDYQQLAQQQKFMIAFDSLYQSGASALAVQSDGTIVCAGFVFTAVPGRTDAALLALDASALGGESEISAGSKYRLQVFPNPFEHTVDVALPASGEKSRITVSDIAGKIIFETDAEGENNHRVDLRNFPAGIYLCRVTGATHPAQAVKIIKTK
ncbi:MAG: hypothetical protein FD123_3425 [Bacteroidetes bacterium]|nr:MAG: hypothetical protein FD123_3425 [Bacteroidota bacterium]